MSQSSHPPSLRQGVFSRAASLTKPSVDAPLAVFAAASTNTEVEIALLARAVVLAFTLGAFTLRLVLINAYPLREDEATYAFWALHGWLQDPNFLHVWPDKPPIFLWLLGFAYQLFGVSETSARFVNIAASTLIIPVTAAIAKRLWGPAAWVIAAVVMALSPFAVSFAPTVYTDPMLVLFGMLALCMAVYERNFVAGLMLGLAVMTKQQGVFYGPLVLGVILAMSYVGGVGKRHSLQRVLMFTVGLLLVVAPILYWDSLRWTVAPSPWDLGAQHYAALSVLRPQQWLSSIGAWARQLWYLAASWLAWLSYGVLVVLALLVGWTRSTDSVQGRTKRTNFVGVLIPVWALGFLLLHVITTIQPWDRYLLPLASMLALAAGWAFSRLSFMLPQRISVLMGILFVLTLVLPAHSAAQGRLPIGADHGDLAGLTQAIRAVEALNEAPYVLYHRELGSQFRYYTHEAVRGTDQTAVLLRWYPSETYLANNASNAGGSRRFLIEPDWAPNRNLHAHLQMRGLTMINLGRYGKFTVWEIKQLAPVPEQAPKSITMYSQP